MFGQYVDPPNPFASRVYRKEPEYVEVPVISDEKSTPVVEPAMTNAKTARAPIVEIKKAVSEAASARRTITSPSCPNRAKRRGWRRQRGV